MGIFESIFGKGEKAASITEMRKKQATEADKAQTKVVEERLKEVVGGSEDIGIQKEADIVVPVKLSEDATLEEIDAAAIALDAAAEAAEHGGLTEEEVRANKEELIGKLKGLTKGKEEKTNGDSGESAA